ncbi:uncharacterized protein NEMAJ01_0905 [Nematocida major]|uniref:uncharacterized protein n=1 Tax=Nematocida major TaxID=1912982 RepID=UPI002008C4BB|nr:uncharacterized protein NEMAJ01_0905 [Nematocida major]KAH9386009.1 hypothetical protein NEMAJ01_0905 [Nematocida major]
MASSEHSERSLGFSSDTCEDLSFSNIASNGNIECKDIERILELVQNSVEEIVMDLKGEKGSQPNEYAKVAQPKLSASSQDDASYDFYADMDKGPIGFDASEEGAAIETESPSKKEKRTAHRRKKHLGKVSIKKDKKSPKLTRSAKMKTRINSEFGFKGSVKNGELHFKSSGTADPLEMRFVLKEFQGFMHTANMQRVYKEKNTRSQEGYHMDRLSAQEKIDRITNECMYMCIPVSRIALKIVIEKLLGTSQLVLRFVDEVRRIMRIIDAENDRVRKNSSNYSESSSSLGSSIESISEASSSASEHANSKEGSDHPSPQPSEGSHSEESPLSPEGLPGSPDKLSAQPIEEKAPSPNFADEVEEFVYPEPEVEIPDDITLELLK